MSMRSPFISAAPYAAAAFQDYSQTIQRSSVSKRHSSSETVHGTPQIPLRPLQLPRKNGGGYGQRRTGECCCFDEQQRGAKVFVTQELSGTEMTCSTFRPVNRLSLRPIPVRTRYRGRGASHV